MTKRLYVSSPVQAALLKDILIPQMKDGFWKDHRPADHARQWEGVEVVVSADGKLGAEDFKVPRTYNFVNPDFIKPNEAVLVAAAQAVKTSSNFRSVKKELIELSRIVGGRLSDKSATPLKANRGGNKQSLTSPSGIIEQARTAVRKATDDVKRTAVRKASEPNVEVFKTSQGATVRRVSISSLNKETV
jgi:hypothetical protein